MINVKVKTPIGEGTLQGNFHPTGAPADEIYSLVRIAVPPETSQHLKSICCLAPRAEKSALFIFPEGLVK